MTLFLMKTQVVRESCYSLMKKLKWCSAEGCGDEEDSWF